ncbi:hypothetical protein E2C01_063694 [Portunus trituberculatus]|uniref:Uncharacterized protein n=1 Tax=Portunus trituberculatus TaxID=210409 RepID=A0A5B7HL70_PORTR|nr:hypothetical protein [Portunus trituberculatus]
MTHFHIHSAYCLVTLYTSRKPYWGIEMVKTLAINLLTPITRS